MTRDSAGPFRLPPENEQLTSDERPLATAIIPPMRSEFSAVVFQNAAKAEANLVRLEKQPAPGLMTPRAWPRLDPGALVRYAKYVIPQHLQPLFWDISTVGFDPILYPQYTIMRVLEFGDQDAVAWLQRIFSREAIKQVVGAERRLSRRSATFWALVYDVPEDQVAALRQR